MVHDTGDVQRAARLTQIKTSVIGFNRIVLNRISAYRISGLCSILYQIFTWFMAYIQGE